MNMYEELDQAQSGTQHVGTVAFESCPSPLRDAAAVLALCIGEAHVRRVLKKPSKIFSLSATAVGT